MKLLDEQISYAKIYKTFVIDVGGGKVLTVSKWLEDDDMFDQFDTDWEIAKNDFMGELTDAKRDKVVEFINELSMWTNNK